MLVALGFLASLVVLIFQHPSNIGILNDKCNSNLYRPLCLPYHQLLRIQHKIGCFRPDIEGPIEDLVLIT